MAIVKAVKTGVWSDPTVWDTGALPTSADDVYSNTFTVTIDVSPTVLSISNAATTGVTAGGQFVMSNGITVNATVSITGGVVGTPAILSTLSSPSQASIVSPLFKINSSAANMLAVTHSGSGTLNLTGDLINNLSNNINGGVITASNTGTGTLNITGNVTVSSTGATFYGAGSVVVNSSTGIINITGNAAVNAGGIAFNSAITNSSTGTINLTGNATGQNGNTLTSAACINNSTGTFTIAGNATAGTGTPAILNNSTGTLNHSGSCTANNGVAAVISSNVSALVTLTGPFLCSSNGTHAVYSPRWFWQNTTPPATYYQIRSANLSVIRPLYTADSVGGNPATTNVRSGTVYGPSDELTGTCAVPPAGSVALGVPVDDTTGTALLTQQNIADALSAASAITLNQQTSSLTTPGSIGERLKLASTVATTAQQLSDALSNE